MPPESAPARVNGPGEEMPASVEQADARIVARAERSPRGIDLATPRLLKPREAAIWLSISERTLWTLTNCGKLPSVRIGRSLRIDANDLLRFIERRKRGELR